MGLENKIATPAGGRVVETAVFGEMTSGAINDIEQAAKLAKALVSRYGMSDEIGRLDLRDSKIKQAAVKPLWNC